MAIHGFESPYEKDVTFSGCDITPVIYGVDASQTPKLYAVGDIATLTYSIHQEKGAVRTLGRKPPKGYTRGPETVAGTLIFNILNRQALWELASSRRNYSTGRTMTLNRMPPFDIILFFRNEAGKEGRLGIFGVQIADEGQSHSIEDTYVENTTQYVAMHVEPLEPTTMGLPANATFMAHDYHRRIKPRTNSPNLPFDYSYLPSIEEMIG